MNNSTSQDLYLDLLKQCLTRYLYPEKYRACRPSQDPDALARLKRTIYRSLDKVLASRKVALVRVIPFDPAKRISGEDWPAEADTMVGLKRLDNLQDCITDVLERGVSGDLIETGVWRGGASIFMRAILKAYGDTERTVWVADSFQGLPKPNAKKYPADAGDVFWQFEDLRVSLDEVKHNFEKYKLLDEQVKFLVGWFSETLPMAPIKELAILRLDGDMYESTMDALKALYHKVSIGGYVIVDDFFVVPGCRKAIEDFRSENRLSEPIERIDWAGAFFKKTFPSLKEQGDQLGMRMS